MAIADFTEISKEDAIAAVRQWAWRENDGGTECGHTGCEDHPRPGRLMIHVMSGFGMDIDLDSVQAEIRNCKRVGWIRHLLDHDLACLTADNRWHFYDAKRPGPVVQTL